MKLSLDDEMFPPFIGFPKEGISFLKQLKRNNNREWFKSHKDRYEEYVKLPMQSLIGSLRAPLSAVAPELDINPRRNMFRIYRDTRFSKNKAPYKTHVAAIFHPKGHWESSAGFYVHIEPDGVYAGGGIYMPDSRQLKKIRREIADQPERFLAIVEDRKFRRIFGSLEGERLHRAPMGFSPEHPMIAWLKFKQFYAGVEWSVRASQSPKFIQELAALYSDLLPLIRFLNEAL
jgi:uncharacterized protein (TIGR02453 family)